MNYSNPKLQSALAAEYVLGTLTGRARDRFENLMLAHPGIKDWVAFWEEKLQPLNESAPEMQPSDRVWKHIQVQLFPEMKKARTQGTGFWRVLGIGASALSVLMAIYIARPLLETSPEIPVSNYFTVFQDDEKQPVWSVQVNQTSAMLKLSALNVPELQADQDYELWLLQPDDQAPISLGLLPEAGELEVPLQSLPYGDAAGVAVSLEPKGGSPTGAPTGPVLYVSQLFDLG